jgi:DNA-binding NarL/FixJ family response regulator
MARHILIADDQPQVRHALRLLLEQELAPETIEEAPGSEALLAQTAAGCPELLLLDWGLPGTAAEDLLVALRKACPALTVIVLSGQPEAEAEALRAGADAFVSKTDPPEQLLAAIRAAEQAGPCCTVRPPERNETHGKKSSTERAVDPLDRRAGAGHPAQRVRRPGDADTGISGDH